MKRNFQMVGIIVLAVLVGLACNLPNAGVTPVTTTINTPIAMGMTQTGLNVRPASTDTEAASGADQGSLSTQVAFALTQTKISKPPELPTNTVTNDNQPFTTQQINTLIDSSNILVYEEIAGDPQYLPYVRRALDSAGLQYVYVGDAMGTFMDKLNSGTKWDLIIMASELRKAIDGDYWTVLKDQVDNQVALVAELWYLDKINAGKVVPFLNECGVEVQANWTRSVGDDRIDYGMYWVEPDNPVFNSPNKVSRLTASLTDPAWEGDVGDLMKLQGGSTAQILASRTLDQTGADGLITSCMEGRVILQTFDSHDYPTDNMIALWENYIIYTLTNHFKAIQ